MDEKTIESLLAGEPENEVTAKIREFLERIDIKFDVCLRKSKK